MEPESSLPHSQVPVTCPYPEPARQILFKIVVAALHENIFF